jgi:site-specific recombinase XerD
MPETMTLKTCADEYVAHLKAAGKAENTIGSYACDLNLVVEHFGADKAMAKFLPVHVRPLFDSERVLKTRAGKEKAPVSVAKTKRAIRMFFDWAGERGHIARWPVAKAGGKKARARRAGAAATASA